ncbi:threonine synthase [Wenzhouxiangella marina]|nr:threonine synthase [Wenzhouxiangella marina]MBB6085760.1 threonine synthase [Wenzhouxiangella marina]
MAFKPNIDRLKPMLYPSTRGHCPPVRLDEALRAGLAPDGGLYVPERIPGLEAATGIPGPDLSATAERVLAPFFADSSLAEDLPRITREALDLPLPIVEFNPGKSWMLELFHGPTAAFKDFAARFLAACLSRLRAEHEPVQTVLVATSGDTGGAVAAAFHRRPGFRVVILYPDGKVSARQAHQLGAFGDNVHCFRVQGNFDDCQRLVKRALNTPELASALALTSANSISIGRLLPQISYYAHSVSQLSAQIAQKVNLIIPTGNLGNALGAVLARAMGIPIGEIRLATNANRTLPDYFGGEDYRGRPGIATLANAMDVGDPSNFERLAWLYREADLRDSGIHAGSVTDEQIRRAIRRAWNEQGLMVCPHTACALELLRQQREVGDDRPWMVAATAHAAKFENVVEPLIEQTIEAPPALAALLERPSHAEDLEPDEDALATRLRALA